MANERDRRLVLEDYERTWATWKGTQDPARKAALGSEMVALIRVGKLLNIEPSWFAQARAGNFRYILQAKKERKIGDKNS